MDTRTPQEIEYDRVRLSRQPADQGPFGTDVTDEMIATLERLEAEHPEASPQEIVTMAAQPERSPLFHDLMAWIDQHFTEDEAFGQLAGGTPIYGLLEAGQRIPCVNINTHEWLITADADGHFAGGTRDGHIAFEDWSLSDITALRILLESDAIERLHAAAVAWAAGDTQPPGDLFDAGFQAGYAAGLEDGRIEARRAA